METATHAAQEKQRFCQAIGEGSTVTEAAACAGVHRVTAYRWREADEQFAADWATADECRKDLYKAELKRRALAGKDDPYSATLLIFALKALEPETFRDRRLEITGKNGGPIEVRSSLDAEIEGLMEGMGRLVQSPPEMETSIPG